MEHYTKSIATAKLGYFVPFTHSTPSVITEILCMYVYSPLSSLYCTLVYNQYNGRRTKLVLCNFIISYLSILFFTVGRRFPIHGMTQLGQVIYRCSLFRAQTRNRCLNLIKEGMDLPCLDFRKPMTYTRPSGHVTWPGAIASGKRRLGSSAADLEVSVEGFTGRRECFWK